MNIVDEILRDVDKVRKLLIPFFPDEPAKVEWWLMTRNPHFGDISPYALIRLGRTHKVVQFIEAAKRDNEPPVLGED